MDIPVHGGQPGKFFNGYYDHHCYFPLYVFCGCHMLVSYLCTSNRSDGIAGRFSPYWFASSGGVGRKPASYSGEIVASIGPDC